VPRAFVDARGVFAVAATAKTQIRFTANLGTTIVVHALGPRIYQCPFSARDSIARDFIYVQVFKIRINSIIIFEIAIIFSRGRVFNCSALSPRWPLIDPSVFWMCHIRASDGTTSAVNAPVLLIIFCSIDTACSLATLDPCSLERSFGDLANGYDSALVGVVLQVSSCSGGDSAGEPVASHIARR